MCKSCHRLHDYGKDPEMRERAAARGKAAAPLGRKALADKLAQDPAFAEQVAAHARNMATPDSRAAGGRAAHAALRADPQRFAQVRARRGEGGAKTSAMRRACSCGLETNPGSLARHQKATGHSSPRG